MSMFNGINLRVFLVVIIAKAFMLVPEVSCAQHQQVINYYGSDTTKVRERFYTRQINGAEVKDGWYEIYYENGVLWQKGKFRNGQLDSAWVDNYDDGSIKQQLNYRNGKLEGLVKIYYPGGAIKEEIPYVNDLPHGQVKLYHENGQVMEISMYEHGRINGLSRGFHEDGKAWFEKHMKAGIENGWGVSYYENGNIREKYLKINGVYDSLFTGYYKDYANGAIQNIIPYENGKIIGTLRSFYPDQSIRIEALYVNDTIHGKYISYYPAEVNKPEGAMLATQDIPGSATYELGNYVKGHKAGVWKTYHPDGSVKSTGKYSLDNRFEGEWLVYYPGGKLKQLGSFHDGLATGPFKIYNESGSLQMEGTYVDDLKEGAWMSYYENGALLSKIEFKNGVRHGKAVAYNENGKLVEERLYNEGELVSEKRFKK